MEDRLETPPVQFKINGTTSIVQDLLRMRFRIFGRIPSSFVFMIQLLLSPYRISSPQCIRSGGLMVKGSLLIPLKDESILLSRLLENMHS